MVRANHVSALLTAVGVILLFATWCGSALQDPTKKNVVMIMLESYRLADTDLSWMDTPNFKKLRKESFLFKNAYAQVGQLGPSRNSLLVGRYPQTTLSYNLNDGYRTQQDFHWNTLPGYFRDVLKYPNVTVGGRFFFNNPGYNRDLSRSFTGTFYKETNANNHCLLDWLVPAGTDGNRIRQIVEGDRYYVATGGNICLEKNTTNAFFSDIDLANAAVKEIKRAAATNNSFFVGFSFDSVSTTNHVKETSFYKYLHKKQSNGPYGPVQYFPKHGDKNAPVDSWINCQKAIVSPKNVKVIMNKNESDSYLPHPVYPPAIQTNVTEAWLYYPTKVFRAAYYAAMETVDEALGIVMKGIDELPQDVKNNTLVVLFSDQGYKLGEHQLYCVRCLFDVDVGTRVYVRDLSKPRSIGKNSNALFDLVDLYPTLVALATNTSGKPVQHGLEGIDQSALLINGETSALRHYSIAQIPNCNESASLYRFENNVLPSPSWSNVNRTLPPDPGSHDGCNRRHRFNITNMGYTVRTNNFRYTTYLLFDGRANAPVNGTEFALAHPVSEELYDHRGKPRASDFKGWPYKPSGTEKDAYQESFVRCNKHGCESKQYEKVRQEMRALLKAYIRPGFVSS